MIKYKNISEEEYYNLSVKERKEKPYCIEYPSRKEWLVNGKFHREDGPAIEYENGSEIWYINGNCHREDGGPAIKSFDGTKFWYINGLRHREDGPAVEYIDGDKYWFINGTSYSFEEWLKLLPIHDEEKIFLRLKYP